MTKIRVTRRDFARVLAGGTCYAWAVDGDSGTRDCG